MPIKSKNQVGETYQRWETPDVRGILDRQEEMVAAGVTGMGNVGALKATEAGPFQDPMGRRKKTPVLRRRVPKLGNR